MGVWMAREKQVVVIDPELWMNRNLHYQERQSGWKIFTSLYWSIYLLFVGALLIFYNPLGLSLTYFFGVSIFLLSLMLIIYGFATSLHFKLMKRYG